MFEDDFLKDAEAILDRCRKEGHRLTTAESCTGGLLSALFTEIAGSSDVFDRGFVTYSNDSKTEMLGVPLELITQFGAVSPEVAVSMAEGALARSYATLAISVTGIAGPGGASEEKPVGLVYIATKREGKETKVLEERFGKKKRSTIRQLTIKSALALL